MSKLIPTNNSHPDNQSGNYWLWDLMTYYTTWESEVEPKNSLLTEGQTIDYFLDVEKKITSFHQYAQNGNVILLESLITQITSDLGNIHPPINETLGIRDINGYTALHLACKYGQKEIIKILLSYMRPQDIQAQTIDKDGYTALHFACLYINDQDITALLLSNENKNKAATNGFTPLHCAAVGGNDKVVDYLLPQLTFKQVTSYTKSGTTPLEAHIHLNYEMSKKMSIKLNYSEKSGFTPLHFAAKKGHTNVVKLLLDYYTDKQPVAASFSNLTDYIILDSSQSQEQQPYSEKKTNDSSKSTALHIAAKGGFADTCQLLLEHNKNLIFIVDNEGNLPLHLASTAEVMIELTRVQQYPALSHRNNEGNTTLHCAVQNNRYDVVSLLLRSMKEFPILIKACHQPNVHNQTPLHLSTSDSISMLLLNNLQQQHILNFTIRRCDDSLEEADQEVNVDNSGNTVLHCASYHGLNKTVELILGCSSRDSLQFFNIINKKGHAAVHLAKNDVIALKLLDVTQDQIIVSNVGSIFGTILSKSKKYCSDETALFFERDDSLPSMTKNPLMEGNLLHLAIKKDFIKTVTKLLTMENIFQQLVNGQDGHGNTPFHLISSGEMGLLLLKAMPEHLNKTNKAGENLLHRAVKLNLCKTEEKKTFAEERKYITFYEYINQLIKLAPKLLSSPDKAGNYPIELAGTEAMVRILASYTPQELLQEVIAKYNGDFTGGIGLIITELSPDVLKFALTSHRQMGGKNATKNEKEKISDSSSDEDYASDSEITFAGTDSLVDSLPRKIIGQKKDMELYFQKEVLKMADTIQSLTQIKDLNSEFDEFTVIGAEQVEKYTDPDEQNKLLFKYANLLYALGEQEESIKNYNLLFQQDPEYIERVLKALSYVDAEFIAGLLGFMRANNTYPWNSNLPASSNGNLLYKFADENQEQIIKLFFKAGIDKDYFLQALVHAITHEKEEQISLFLKNLCKSVANDNELWQVPAELLSSVVEQEKHNLTDLFLGYVPAEAVNPAEGTTHRILHSVQSEEMFRKVLGKYPELKVDKALEQNLDGNHCIKLIAYYNLALGHNDSNYILYLKKGYILASLDLTEKALAYFAKAKEHFSEYKPEPKAPVKYTGEGIKELIGTQLEKKDKTLVDVVTDISTFEFNIEDGPLQSKALALRLLKDYWINVFVHCTEEKSTFICPSFKFLETLIDDNTVAGMGEAQAKGEIKKLILGTVGNIQGFFLTKGGVEHSNIFVDQAQGLPDLVINNLIKLANYRGNFTNAEISQTLDLKSANPLQLQVKHQLMLENDGFYSDLKFITLLKVMLPKGAYISEAIHPHDWQGLAIAVTSATTAVLEDTYQAAVIPLHPRENHWSSLVIKKDNHGGIFVIYSDATGNPLASVSNAENLINCTMHLSTKTTLIDLQHRQTTYNDNGAYAINNIVHIMMAWPFELQEAAEIEQEVAEKQHIQKLIEAGIPLGENINKGVDILAPKLSTVKCLGDCFNIAGKAYEAGKLEESLNYYTKAMKFFNPFFPALEVEGSKLEWLSDKATGAILAKLFITLQNYQVGEEGARYSPIALKSEASHAALLIGYKEPVIQMIHIDSEGILLISKESIVSTICEIIGSLPISIVDIACKLKEKSIEYFEAAIGQIQKIDCEFDKFNRENLQKQLADFLELDVDITGSVVQGEFNQ